MVRPVIGCILYETLNVFFATLVYRIPPFYYLHVLDQNTNVTRLEVGPKTFVKQDHEKVILGPERMLIIPYVRIQYD